MREDTTILLIDDHPFVREGLKAIVDRLANHVVVGEAGNAAEGLELARQLKPDVVLLDISLPDRSGLSVIEDLKKMDNRVAVLILSMHSSAQCVVDAFQAGASGYLTKDSAATKLAEALATVLDGKRYYPEGAVREKIFELFLRPDLGAASISKREQEVLRLIAEGHSSKVVGEKLFISPKTVETHRQNIMRKLELHSTVDIVRYAIRMKLVAAEE